jgi:hypothetical protein
VATRKGEHFNMLTKSVWEYDRFTPSWAILGLFAFLFSGSARADTFVFDATSSQIAGHYIPVGGGHFNGGAEIFDILYRRIAGAAR